MTGVEDVAEEEEEEEAEATALIIVENVDDAEELYPPVAVAFTGATILEELELGLVPLVASELVPAALTTTGAKEDEEEVTPAEDGETAAATVGATSPAFWHVEPSAHFV